jgi:hypothetical protein
MVKIADSLAYGKKVEIKKISFFTRFLVTLLLMIMVFVVAFTITYFRRLFIFSPPRTYQECINRKGSVIQESYPAVCVSPDGNKFIQPLSEEEQKLLESHLNQSSQNTEIKTCGGIAGILCPDGLTCQYDGNHPDASGKCVSK